MQKTMLIPRSSSRFPTWLRPLVAAFCLFALTFFLTACDSSGEGFRIEGRFANLNQGEFYLYNALDGSRDTIGVRDGRFTYAAHFRDTVTLMLMFPNYSELPIIAHDGAKVSIKGDVSHLRETTVSGTRENQQLTDFRLSANEKTPPEVVDAARLFITEHPSSPVSVYLLQHYFLQTAKPDYAEASRLCKMLLKAAPENGQLVRLDQQLKHLSASAKGSRLPAFSAKTVDGKPFSSSQLKAEVNVVLAWASWHNESKNILRAVNRWQKKYPKRLSVVSISLDASPGEGVQLFRRDSITWPSLCDGMMWQSPCVLKLGLASLPGNLIVDKSGKIIDRNLPTVKDVEARLKELLDEP